MDGSETNFSISSIDCASVQGLSSEPQLRRMYQFIMKLEYFKV